MIVQNAIQQKKNDPKRALSKLYEAVMTTGAPFDYNGTTYHTQLRSVDQSNLRWFAFETQQALASGVPDTTIFDAPNGFKVHENVFLPLTLAEFLAMVQTASAWGKARYLAKNDVEQDIENGIITDASQVATAFETKFQERINA